MNSKTATSQNRFVLGLKYALYFMLIAGLMGFIYGAVGGVWFTTAFVAIAYLGIFVVINMVVAFPTGIINLMLLLFGKGSPTLSRYFIYSASFALIFLLFFALIKITGISPF